MILNDLLLQSLFDETERRPLTVSELNAEVRSLLELQFASVWVEGEVVGFTQAGSGHWYFTLNDGAAQIKCVCWKGINYRVRFKPQNGIAVRIRGKITLYAARGECQIVVESLEPSGEGALAAAYEQIKAKLDADGLFDPGLKRPIPFFPRRVAVVTSRKGAAYHDIQSVLKRRSKSVSIILIPTLVQGEGAADGIRKALSDVNAFNKTLSDNEKIDVVIVGRGGGSPEDLWAFNDEMLARAIGSSEIPVISAVGHEIDWTIADLVSDLRAATPSAAAEMVAGREEDIIHDLLAGEERLASIVEYKMLNFASRFRDAAGALQTAFSVSFQTASNRFADVSARFTPASLTVQTTLISHRLATLDQRRVSVMDSILKFKLESLNVKMAKLEALSPLAVLTRGYSITQAENGQILRDAGHAKPGDKLKIRLERGKLIVEVVSEE